MKKSLIIAFLFSICGFQTPNVLFVVKPSYSDIRIHEIEDSLKSQYGIIAKIDILKRDTEGNIVHLKYSKTGGGGCESDNFGALQILAGGCRISVRIK